MRPLESWRELKMLSGIDHVVVLVRNLAEAVAGYEALGFTVTPGGEHGGGATHNALIGFQDGTYFELIAFTEADRPQDHRWWKRLVAGEGLVDYALRADRVATVVEDARGRGLELGAATDGSRRRPDGQQLAWRSVTSGRPVGSTALPFAIEDVTPHEARVPGGDAANHRPGVRGVAELVIAVRDLEASARDLQAMLGTKPAIGESGAVFSTGGQRLRLVQPDAADSYDGTGLSLAEHLSSRGEGPYEVVLDAASPSGVLLPVEQTHGARIRLGSA
jgi:catechol 2,3-dioxygenase-like lactoylglutathione lyase family enzyme